MSVGADPLSKHPPDALQPWNPAVSQPEGGHQWPHEEPAHVLVVEDDPAIRELLSAVLTRQGYRARVVATGHEGLAAIAESPAQVLVTDYRLPDMDGLSLLEQASRYDPRIAGIVMTGHGTIELAVRAMKAGAADMITKPFSPNDVVLAIRRVLEVQQLRQENRVLKQAVMRGVRINPFQLSDIASGAHLSRGAAAGTKSPEYLRGVADGERQARERLAHLQRQETLLTGIARQMAHTCAALPERMEAEIVTLAFEIARKVVHGCVEEKRDLVLLQAREALARVRESKLVRILVHPSDLAMVEGAAEQLTQAVDGPVTMKIEGDPTVAPGGCRVQTPTHLVDASVDGQLAKIAEGLRASSNHETH